MPRMSKNMRHEEKQRSHKDTRLTMYSRVSPVASRLRTQLIYADNYVCSTLQVYDFVFNLNSLFDPNRTGTGHQPLGFDQLSALYQRYRVYRVKYEIGWVNTSLDASIMVVLPSNNASSLTSVTTAQESQGAVSSRVGNVYNAMYLKGTVDLAQVNGRTPQQYADDDVTGALTSANPAETIVLHVVNTNLTGTAATGTATVKLTFDCEFYDPVQLAQS